MHGETVKFNRLNLTPWRLNTKRVIKDVPTDFARVIRQGEQKKFFGCEFSQAVPGGPSDKFS
jgi:hypothetical protein